MIRYFISQVDVCGRKKGKPKALVRSGHEPLTVRSQHQACPTPLGHKEGVGWERPAQRKVNGLKKHCQSEKGLLIVFGTQGLRSSMVKTRTFQEWGGWKTETQIQGPLAEALRQNQREE